MQLNIILPARDAESLKEMKDEVVIISFTGFSEGRMLYVIDTNENYASFLILKYGKNNVWAR